MKQIKVRNTQPIRETEAIGQYLEQRQAIAKDEINGALNVAVLVVVSAQVIIQCVLSSQKLAAHKCSCIP